MCADIEFVLTADFGAFFQWLLTGILSGQTYCRHTHIYIYIYTYIHLNYIVYFRYLYVYDDIAMTFSYL